MGVLNSPKYKFIKNLVFSATSIALSVGFMQFVFLPLIAANMQAEEYGFMLTIVAIVDVFGVTFGGTLCNVRLIKREQYTNRNPGDFTLLSLVYSGLACILSLVISRIYGLRTIVPLVLVGVYAVVVFYNSYGAVYFRLKKKFSYELLSAIIMIAGYLIGYLIFKMTGSWQFIYILGYLFGFVFSAFIYGKILREPPRKTELFPETNKSTAQLNISSLLKELVTYTDKLVLFRLMGGVTVAVYNSAAIIGKCVALVTNPVNGLLLSHLSDNKKRNKHFLNYGWIIAIVIVFVCYWVFLAVSRPLLNLLYPQYCKEAMEIIRYTLIAAMANAVVAMINPFILKMCEARIQIYMNTTSFVIYLISAFAFFSLWGLLGFCIAVILAGVVKLCFLAFCTVRINKST